MYPNLKAEASKRCVSQAALADAAGVTPRTIGNWLNGDTQANVEQARAIKALFPGARMERLFKYVPSDK